MAKCLTGLGKGWREGGEEGQRISVACRKRQSKTYGYIHESSEDLVRIVELDSHPSFPSTSPRPHRDDGDPQLRHSAANERSLQRREAMGGAQPERQRGS